MLDAPPSRYFTLTVQSAPCTALSLLAPARLLPVSARVRVLTMSKVLQHLVSKQKKRIQISGFDLDLAPPKADPATLLVVVHDEELF